MGNFWSSGEEEEYIDVMLEEEYKTPLITECRELAEIDLKCDKTYESFKKLQNRTAVIKGMDVSDFVKEIEEVAGEQAALLNNLQKAIKEASQKIEGPLCVDLSKVGDDDEVSAIQYALFVCCLAHASGTGNYATGEDYRSLLRIKYTPPASYIEFSKGGKTYVYATTYRDLILNSPLGILLTCFAIWCPNYAIEFITTSIGEGNAIGEFLEDFVTTVVHESLTAKRIKRFMRMVEAITEEKRLGPHLLDLSKLEIKYVSNYHLPGGVDGCKEQFLLCRFVGVPQLRVGELMSAATGAPKRDRDEMEEKKIEIDNYSPEIALQKNGKLAKIFQMFNKEVPLDQITDADIDNATSILNTLREDEMGEIKNLKGNVGLAEKVYDEHVAWARRYYLINTDDKHVQFLFLRDTVMILMYYRLTLQTNMSKFDVDNLRKFANASGATSFDIPFKIIFAFFALFNKKSHVFDVGIDQIISKQVLALKTFAPIKNVADVKVIPMGDENFLVAINNVFKGEQDFNTYIDHAQSVKRSRAAANMGRLTPRYELSYTVDGKSYVYSGVAHTTVTYPPHIALLSDLALAELAKVMASHPEMQKLQFHPLERHTAVDIVYSNTLEGGGSIAAHSDNEVNQDKSPKFLYLPREKRVWTVVMVYSIGQTRKMQFRKLPASPSYVAGDKSNNIIHDMVHNGFVFMVGRKFQDHWTHQVDKLSDSAPVGTRLSLNVRYAEAWPAESRLPQPATDYKKK